MKTDSYQTYLLATTMTYNPCSLPLGHCQTYRDERTLEIVLAITRHCGRVQRNWVPDLAGVAIG
jgi:hypothetical protein